MVVNVYSMRDEFQGYLTPTFEMNDNLALRNFKFALNRKDTLLYANPKHFDLYKIGTYDSDTGKLESVEPILIATGLSVVEVEDGK